MNMKMKMIAAAAVALTGNAAFAAACDAAAATEGNKLFLNCSPELTFYAPGATAMKGAIQNVLTSTAADSIFDSSKSFVTISADGNADLYAYYGFHRATGKRLLVIVNGKNGSMAGVNQLLTKLKQGSMEGTVNKEEYKIIKLVTASMAKASASLPLENYTSLTQTSAEPSKLKWTVKMIGTEGTSVDFKTGWALDKQKVAHMAFSDVRPSEATPGQIAKWANASFPSETIAMQGFGITVNNNLYKELVKRDVREGRITDPRCIAAQTNATPAITVGAGYDEATHVTLGACQPNLSRADITALITGKTLSASALLRVPAADVTATDAKVLYVNRRPASSGTQAAVQIQFAGQNNYVGKAPVAGVATPFNTTMAGSPYVTDGSVGAPHTSINSGKVVVKTHSGTGALLASVGMDTTDFSFGVASLDNASASKFGTPGLVDGSTTAYEGKSAATPAAQVQRWVKIDGISPDFKNDGTVDAKQRVGLQNGYSFAFEFQTLKSTALSGDYLAIYNAIVAGLKATSGNLTGIGYLAGISTFTPAEELSHKSTFTRNGNNYFPLSK